MRALFVRALALGARAQEAQSVAGASRTTADGTFAVASGLEGVIRVYAASCAALLHEFSTIHRRILTLHYTSFSDSLITLESDGDDDGDDDAETFLCVYHDWRERKIVRGYTLPLGALDSPASRRKADCIAVCSFTGRVVVAMGAVINIWQCSHGLFEHVMELKVDMAQHHAYLQVERVAIHGVYVAYASQTEVRVMEIHVKSSKDEGPPSSLGTNGPINLAGTEAPRESDAPGSNVPEDAEDCVCVGQGSDLDTFIEVPIPHSSYFSTESDTKTREQDEQRIFEEPELPTPMILRRNEAQQEAWNLAGLVKSQDIRTNQAMSYFVGENDVTVLLRRYLPPNHCVTSLKFLPETIDNRFSVETRSYTRLLIATEQNAFLYYFLSEEVDTTRKKMSKKVLGKGERTRSTGVLNPIKLGKTMVGSSNQNLFTKQYDERAIGETLGAQQSSGDSESGRVVMHYTFTSPVTCIEANSSFLFVSTISGLQVWSIWSPCHYVAASRALSESLVPQPSQPQLLCTQPVPFLVSQIAALDSYVILLPHVKHKRHESMDPQLHFSNMLRTTCMAAVERLPEGEFETRRSRVKDSRSTASAAHLHGIRIFQQSPPSLIFSSIHDAVLSSAKTLSVDQIDLLLSLFSLYRYRADIGFDLLSNLSSENTEKRTVDAMDQKERVALELETHLYNRLAKQCAADLAGIFMSEQYRNLERAALLYVASNVPSIEVMKRLRKIMGAVDRSVVANATGKYLEAFVFPPPPSLGAIMATPPTGSTSIEPNNGFTRTVLLHYDKHFPEQLARLVIDSSLPWSLPDLALAYLKLKESTSHSILVRVATLVLVLRSHGFSQEAWNAFKLEDYGTEEASVSDFIDQCSTESITSTVLDLYKNHNDSLRHLAITHPRLLILGDQPNETGIFSGSIMTKVILDNTPTFFLDILEQVFIAAIGRQETLHSILTFCFAILGKPATCSARRMFDAVNVSVNTSMSEAFAVDQVFALRHLMFVLQMMPSLEILAERDELRDDEDTLQQIKGAVVVELVQLCVQLVSHRQDDDDVVARLVEIFGASGSTRLTEAVPSTKLWIQSYLEKRCLADDQSVSRDIMAVLLDRAVDLVLDRNLCNPERLLAAFRNSETVGSNSNWTLTNDFAALIVLLTLPRTSR